MTPEDRAEIEALARQAVAEQQAVKFWRCHHCDRGFIHARYLTTHLIGMHGEMTA